MSDLIDKLRQQKDFVVAHNYKISKLWSISPILALISNPRVNFFLGQRLDAQLSSAFVNPFNPFYKSFAVALLI
jgi:hypothetical protein